MWITLNDHFIYNQDSHLHSSTCSPLYLKALQRDALFYWRIFRLRSRCWLCWSSTSKESEFFKLVKASLEEFLEFCLLCSIFWWRRMLVLVSAASFRIGFRLGRLRVFQLSKGIFRVWRITKSFLLLLFRGIPRILLTLIHLWMTQNAGLGLGGIFAYWLYWRRSRYLL